MRKARRRAKPALFFLLWRKSRKKPRKAAWFSHAAARPPGGDANAFYALSEVPSTFSRGAALAAAAASAAAFSSISF